jgi:hypothetical protein
MFSLELGAGGHSVHRIPPGVPTVIERRNSRMRCRSCRSFDIWRIDERPGILAAIMRFRGRKPFQCRACRQIFYRRARRSKDRVIEIAGT